MQDLKMHDLKLQDLNMTDLDISKLANTVRIHFIFLARILIGLHFLTNDIGLSSLKFF